MTEIRGKRLERRNMNRQQRRKLKSKKRGATQMNHPTFVKKLKAEQDDSKTIQPN